MYQSPFVVRVEYESGIFNKFVCMLRNFLALFLDYLAHLRDWGVEGLGLNRRRMNPNRLLHHVLDDEDDQKREPGAQMEVDSTEQDTAEMLYGELERSYRLLGGFFLG